MFETFYELCGEYNVPIQFMLESGLKEFIHYIRGRMRRILFNETYLAGLEIASVELHGNLHGAGTKSQQAQAERRAKERLKHMFGKLFKDG